ncbi:uncharacterized protein LOC142357443, partial [Convolutriloba macropyga]|uniref:uncharacterized protein LOC142357443 n=1 Tax=Convolutriloba macropyga TaxID=536237 RepID=UPI003F522BB1
INSLNELVKNSDSLGDDLKQLLRDVNLESLLEEASQIQEHNVLLLSQKLLQFRQESTVELQKVSEQLILLQESHAKLQSDDSKRQLDLDKLTSENSRLQTRLQELSTALELADEQLQKIDFSEVNSLSQQFNRNDQSNNRSESSDNEDLKQTQFLLEESLSSNQKMSSVMEDQKHELEVLQNNLSHLQKQNSELTFENESLKELTDELSGQIAESEKNLEKLRQEQIAAMQTSESADDRNNLALDRSRTPEFQLSIVTELQNEVLSLKKKLKKNKAASDRSSLSPEKPRSSSNNASPSTPVSIASEVIDSSILEQALLDKEEMIVKLNREIEGFKNTIADLYRENDSRFETQTELLSLKDQLIGLQNALEKQEDQIVDKDFTIEKLQQELDVKIEQHLEETNHFKTENDRLRIVCAEIEDREKTMQKNIELLQQKISEANAKYDKFLENLRELITNVFPVLVHDGLNLGEAEILTNLAQIVGNVIQENEKLKSILQSESDEKDQSINKISELNRNLKSVKNDLESERNSNAALREQVQEMMNKLVNVTNETNDYGLRLKQVSEKLASSIHEKCDLNSKLSNLLQERDVLLQSIEQLRVEKESLLAEIDKLKLQLTECKDICEKLTIEIELLVSRNCEISDEISRETAILHDDYTAKSESLNSEMRELKSQMRQLENELKCSEDSKQEVSNELLTKENELAKVNSDLKSVYAELETIFNTNDCNEISLIVTWMKNEVKRLEDENSSKDAKIDEFDAKIEILKSELQTKDKEIRSKDYKEKRLERDIEDYKVKIQNFSDKNEYLQDECNLLTERNETLAGTIAQLENYLQISEKKLSETLSGDWEQRFVKECETVSTQKSQISELRNLVEGYESQLNEALEDYESLKQRYTAVSERVSGNDLAFKEEIASLKERVSTITCEKLHLNSQVEDSKQQISTLSRQLKELYLKVQNFEVVVNDKDGLIASLNEKLISSNEKLAQSESSLLSIEKQFSEKMDENQEFVTNKADLKAKIDELNNEVEKLKSKNAALSEILNENETGWNQKFQKQQEDFETYAQQAYQVRAHYDQLLYAYNEKTQQNSDLEKTVESLKEENSKLEERLIDASSMAPVAFNETQISTESEQKLTSSYPPDLLQVSSSNDLKSASEVLQREINSKDEQISKLKTERSQLQEVIAEKISEIESLTSKSAEINDQLNKKGIEIKEFSAKNEKLSTELVRLREHMLKIEEGYTQEALAAEEREKNLRTKLYQVEENLQRVTSTSNVIDSELLTKMSEQEAQLFEVTSRSKQTEVQLRDMTQQMNLYKDASQNLQLVLENFHKEQEREKRLSDEASEKQVSSVNEQKQQLESKLKKLNSKLDKQQELLEQAAHLSSEMELREEEIERLRGEVDAQMVQVSKWKKKAQEASGSGVVGERVEKQLVRNLLVAYLTVPNNKKSDALNMIARFLEFSEQERNKVGINAQRGWFSGWMPSANNNATQAKGGGQPTDSASQQQHQDSFTQKFIEFLESESSKPNVVSLPHHHLNPQSTGELSIETGFSKPPLGAPSSISKSKYPSAGSRGGGFNPFSPTVLPQLRPQHSPSVSLSGGSISSLEDEPSFTSRLRQEDSFTPRQNRSRNSSSNSSSHHNSVQGTTASTPKMYPSSSGGPNAQNSSLDYSSDQSDTSSTVQFAHKRETSFLKDLLQEH